MEPVQQEQTSQASKIKQLIAKGHEQGYLTYAEVNDHLPQDVEPERIEEIINQTQGALSKWEELAAKYGVSTASIALIKSKINL